MNFLCLFPEPITLEQIIGSSKLTKPEVTKGLVNDLNDQAFANNQRSNNLTIIKSLSEYVEDSEKDNPQVVSWPSFEDTRSHDPFFDQFENSNLNDNSIKAPYVYLSTQLTLGFIMALVAYICKPTSNSSITKITPIHILKWTATTIKNRRE